MAKKRDGLQQIPGIGKNMEQHLLRVGVQRVEDLRGRDPRELYDLDCLAAGGPLDRCVLYVFRCAVYYAGTANPDPEKLKWWYWKD